MKIIIATKNKGKLKEFSRILEPLGFEVISQEETGFTEEVEETGVTFSENAFLKADAIHKFTGKPTVADDSGLEVFALGNRPGVFSARYAGSHATDEENNAKLIREMQGKTDRRARYVCAICYIDENGKAKTFTGICEGEISLEPHGDQGFGYDPFFVMKGRSFGEYSSKEKDAVSHRGKALRLLAAEISSNK